MKIKVPASSANLGPGFDSYGIALAKYLTVEAEVSNEWLVTFKTESLNVLPNDETNLVIQVAKQIAKKYEVDLPTLHLTMESEIPLTHGMGSSASAIVAGIEIANHFGRLALTQADKIRLASEIEGHPDNVGAAITGGLFVGYHQEDEFYYESVPFTGVTVIMSIPPYELSTHDSRSVLPEQYSKQDSIAQNALSSVLLLSLMKGNYHQMGQLMMSDKFHEPYRQTLIAEFTDVKETSLANGAYATVISGAGPSMLTICREEEAENILHALQQAVPIQHEIVKIHKMNE